MGQALAEPGRHSEPGQARQPFHGFSSIRVRPCTTGASYKIPSYRRTAAVDDVHDRSCCNPKRGPSARAGGTRRRDTPVLPGASVEEGRPALPPTTQGARSRQLPGARLWQGVATGRMADALGYFEEQLSNHSAEEPEPRLRRVFNTVCQRLEFMCATLEAENAYNIFKSLNSTGVPLGPSDLIRNFVFMHVPPDEQDEFDRALWSRWKAAWPGQTARSMKNGFPGSSAIS